jgi:hypothetical protein
MKKTVKIPILHTTVHLLIGEISEVRRYIPEDFRDVFSGEYLARCAWDDYEAPRDVWIHSKSRAISVLAHEAVHAGMVVLSSRGIGHSADDDEMLAYFVQHICNEAEVALGTYTSIGNQSKDRNKT